MKKVLLCLALTGLALCVLAGTALADPVAPTVSAIDPARAPNDVDTAVTITGVGFATATDGSGAPPTVTLGTTALTDVTWVDAGTLTATVPWGIEAGVYDLTVVNPDGGTGSLTDAFTVDQGLGRWNGGDLDGGDVRQILMKPGDPDTLYASAYGVAGLFRSQDAGDHWAYMSDDVAIGNGRYAVDPDPLHADWLYGYGYSTRTEQGGLFRSTDGGAAWTMVMPNTWPDGRGVATPQVYVSPHDSNVLFVGAAHEPDDADSPGAAGLIKSTDGGQSWHIVADMDDVSVQGVAFHPADPSQMVLATTTGDVYRSTDAGDTWSTVTKPPLTSLGTFDVIAYNPDKPTEVWVAHSDVPQTSASGTICKSTDADFTSWTTVTPADGSGSQSLTFTGADSVWIDRHHSTDGGTSWQPVGTMTGGGGFAFDPGDAAVGYLCDGVYGVQKTTDGGQDWQVKNEGLTGMVCREMDVSSIDPLRIYAPFGGFGGFYRSDDGAASWTFSGIEGFYNERQVYEDPFDAGRLYAAGDQDLYESTSAGASWEKVGWNMTPAPASGSPHDMQPDPLQTGHLLVGWNSGPWATGTGRLFNSTDSGSTWQEASTPAGMTSVNSIAFDPGTPGLVFATTNASGVYRSTDGGSTWAPIDYTTRPDMRHAGAIAIATHPRHVVLIATAATPAFRSFDGGDTWERAASAPSGGDDYMFAGADSSRLYFGAPFSLFRSTDAGDTWTRAAGAFGHLQVTALGWAHATDHTIIYAATAGGHTGTTGAAVATAPRAALTATNGLVPAGVYRYILVPTPRVTLTLVGLKAGAITFGKRVAVKGAVSPSRLAGSRIKISVQRWKGRWVTVRTKMRTISAKRTYGWSYRPAARGAYRLRATIAASATHTSAVTGWRKFRVK